MLDEAIISKLQNEKLPKKSGIYGIRNLINGKIYIGSSTNLRKRKGYHFPALKKNKHRNAHLQSAYNKYGENNFLFFILEFCEIERLEELEQFYIDYYNSADREMGYNIRNIVSLSGTCSDETRIKISEGKKRSNKDNPKTHCRRGHNYVNNDGTSNRGYDNSCIICKSINERLRANKIKSGEHIVQIQHDKRKSTCSRGHERSEENTYYHNNNRFCRVCIRMRANSKNKRKKE